MKPRYTMNRKDENEREIVERLRASGYSVMPMFYGADIIVGYGKMNFIFEIKNPNAPKSKQALTPGEIKIHREWNGQIHTVKTYEQIIQIVGDQMSREGNRGKL